MTREKKLIRKIEYGDREALGELIEMYYPDILRILSFSYIRASLCRGCSTGDVPKGSALYGCP